MSDTQVLDFLRVNFARVHERLDGMALDIANIKARMNSVEAAIGHLTVGVAELNGRFDRLETRVERIERRLDLVQAP